MGLELLSLPYFFNWSVVDLQYYIFQPYNIVFIFIAYTPLEVITK